jgi:hypothetical protein
MTVSFMGCEVEDFASFTGTVEDSTFTSGLRSTNVRANIKITGTTTEDANRLETAAFALDDFWTKFVLGYASVPPTGVASHNIAKWYAGGTPRLALRWTNVTTGALEIRKWNGASWDSLATGTLAAAIIFGTTNSYRIFDVHIKLGNPGAIRLYCQEILVISDDTVDLTWSGVTDLDKVVFNSLGATAARDAYYSEVLVTDWSTIAGKVVSKGPDANGNYQEWGNSAFGNVDEVVAGADFATSGTADQRTCYSMGAFPALGTNEAIAAVQMAATANRDAAGPQNANLFTRISSTDYHGSDKSLNVAATFVQQKWETSPATAAAWTIAEINGAEFGVRSRT